MPDLLPRPRKLTPGAGALALGAGPPEIRTEVAVEGIPSEGYRLTVTPERVVIEARKPVGLFYGKATLAQWTRLHAAQNCIPAVTIQDSPDFPHRGVMLDVSRDKVPTMGTLYRLIDELASLKINRLQLYMEHTFAYRAHPVVWADASPFTGAEIEKLADYCRARFIKLIPNQNSFGHMERWLKHPEYAHLAEVAEPTGDYMSLCPIDPRSIDLLAGLYDELFPHFMNAGESVNVGCDETIDLGKGRSREAVESRGRGEVYLEFVKKLHALVTARERRMQMWGDIVLEHPELIPRLPKDVIALEWGYEADHPFDANGAKFAQAGLDHIVCPGTSTWLSLAGRTANALANIESATAAALKHGARGVMITDWGDFGHWQPLPVSYLPLAYGAALAWCQGTNRGLDIAAATDLHLFRDRAAATGGLLRDLGNVYRETGVLVKNSSVLALLLLFPERPLGEGRLAGLTMEGLERADASAAEIASKIGASRCDRDDAALIDAELSLAAGLLRHACRFGIARLKAEGGAVTSIAPSARRALAEDLRSIIDEYERIWLLRNRVGGLSDSVGRLEHLQRLY